MGDFTLLLKLTASAPSFDVALEDRSIGTCSYDFNNSRRIGLIRVYEFEVFSKLIVNLRKFKRLESNPLN